MRCDVACWNLSNYNFFNTINVIHYFYTMAASHCHHLECDRTMCTINTQKGFFVLCLLQLALNLMRMIHFSHRSELVQFSSNLDSTFNWCHIFHRINKLTAAQIYYTLISSETAATHIYVFTMCVQSFFQTTIINTEIVVRLRDTDTDRPKEGNFISVFIKMSSIRKSSWQIVFSSFLIRSKRTITSRMT